MSDKTPFPEVMWFIAGTFANVDQAFLYTGAYRTRAEAIRDHTKSLGLDWQACRRSGDRAVKCLVTPITKEHPND